MTAQVVDEAFDVVDLVEVDLDIGEGLVFGEPIGVSAMVENDVAFGVASMMVMEALVLVVVV